jgi:hypothetical protein
MPLPLEYLNDHDVSGGPFCSSGDVNRHGWELTPNICTSSGETAIQYCFRDRVFSLVNKLPMRNVPLAL